MTYPQSSKGLTEGLKREVQRRIRDCESPIEYFAPTFVEAVEVKGQLVNSEKLLLFNYFFVHASEEQIYRMKQFEPQYNFFRKRYDGEGVGCFPFVTEEVINSLRCIAEAYCGKLPVYIVDAPWLIKGDRVKITRGQFKGVEATLFENQQSGNKEIMVSLDDFAWVPILKLKPGDYELLELYNKNAAAFDLLTDKQLLDLHAALMRKYLSLRESATTEVIPLNSDTVIARECNDRSNLIEDKQLAEEIIKQFQGIAPNSDIKRSKMFTALLLSYKILDDEPRLTALMSTIKQMLPAVKAEHPRALLLLALYAVSSNEVYRNQFLEHTASWTKTGALKKNKQLLLEKFTELESVL